MKKYKVYSKRTNGLGNAVLQIETTDIEEAEKVKDQIDALPELCAWVEENMDAQQIAHERGEPCDEDGCQDCCGEFTGHEFDSSEGGYCECGANGYE